MGSSLIRSLRSGPILRHARIISVIRDGPDATKLDLEVLEGPLRGRLISGLLYGEHVHPPETGETVTANTVGLEMGLGTGGVAPVLPMASDADSAAPENENHFVKLPYTALQFPVSPVAQAENLDRVPLIVLPLHSHLAPACCAIADLWPGSRVSFVWQEGGALPVAFSDTVRDLKEKSLLHTVVSSGNCFGGDLESPNIYGGLLTAAAVSDVVVAGIGPGVIGTGTKHGHGGMSAALALNAACSLGADPVLAPRISAADKRSRHRGISHHTKTALEATLGGCRVAYPESADLSTEELPKRHSHIRVAYGAGGLEDRFGVTFRSMGRSYAEDSIFFDAAAAAALVIGRKGQE